MDSELELIVVTLICDAAMTASAMERLVYAHGFGGVYCGFFTNAVRSDPEIHHKLGMQEQDEILLTFAAGRPKYAFGSLVPRRPLRVTWL